MLTSVIVVAAAGSVAAAPCDEPVASVIACENSKPGNPQSEWGIAGAGSASIQGFATDMSVDQGATIGFKVDTTVTAYRLDIYRMGHYGGAGARKVTTVQPTSVVDQPNCLTQASTGLVDCGNWSLSASWAVPVDAVSGVYFAKLVATAGGSGASHVYFVVRDDDGRSELLFQTSDTTWQAYNRYGGNSLYTGSPAGRAYKVSYNRPFTTRDYASEDFVFNAEYPMVRWLESNGFDVSYTSGVDTDRRGAELLEHEVFVSVGHDEYWSGGQRSNVEAARAAGVHLAFFSGNEVFWKTRWETSIDGSGTPHRTLVSYKETHANSVIDPAAPTWTGTWRDPRFSPPGDGGRPENALTGQLFTVNCCAVNMVIGAADGDMRFWRSTRVAALSGAQTTTVGSSIVGYEWDEDVDNGHRPTGSFRVSQTAGGGEILQDHGSTYANGSATHSMTMYRHPSGAFVFGAGTIQWSWALDSNHDRGSAAPDVAAQQATLNLLADMGAQPATIQAGLVTAVQSTDTSAPSASISAPSPGTSPVGAPITITGSAVDAGGGRVGGVEVSVDDGATWRRATGRESWTYTFTPPAPANLKIRARAVDDSATIGSASAAVDVTVANVPVTCPCTIWPATATPDRTDADTSAVEVGVKFQAASDGFITAIRFHKSATNTGTHVGSLWTASGTRLGTVTFSGETASGWQQATFSSPIAVTAGTTYVASYHAPNAQYSVSSNYFATAVSRGPLTALASGSSGGNGVYRYGTTASNFPTSTFQAENYWVDVVFETSAAPDTTAPTVTARVPGSGATGVAVGSAVSATFSESVQAGSVQMSLAPAGGSPVAATVAYAEASRTATLTPAAALTAATDYTVTVSGARDTAGNTMEATTWTFTTAAAPPPVTCPCTIWPATATPDRTDADTSAVEVGVKFQAASDGFITAIRFHKSATNTGTHVGSLWTASGTRLGTVTFSGETASGWQQATFSSPIAVTAGTTYVASYHAPNAQYSVSSNYFATAVSRGPLTALASGSSGGNGVYRYGTTASNFPTSTFQAENYWVDVVFETSAAPDTTAPTVTARVPGSGATGVAVGSAVSATFSESVQAGSVQMSLAPAGGSPVAATVAYAEASRTATLTPAAALTAATDYTATVSGARDTAGNTMEATTWTFTTAAAPPPVTCPCTIWPATATPATLLDPSTTAVELGVKFRATTDGFITGIRFYKGGTANGGTHRGRLWTSSGTQLASANFSGETASGWQQVNFAQPVAVTAGSTYVASYYAPRGRYSRDVNYFTSATSRGPLTALASGTEGGNGVYRNGTGFPTSTWNASNYWVDVVFRTNP